MAQDFGFGNKSKDKKEKKPHHHHINYLLVIVIMLLLLIAVIIKPAFIGYKLTKQFEGMHLNVDDIIRNVNNMEKEIVVCRANAISLQNANTDCIGELTQEKNASMQLGIQYQQLISEKGLAEQAYTHNITQMKSEHSIEINRYESLLDSARNEKESMELRYDATVSNAARNICCKQKVDDNSIDSYIISGNSIVCSSGADNKLSC